MEDSLKSDTDFEFLHFLKCRKPERSVGIKLCVLTDTEAARREVMHGDPTVKICQTDPQ